MALLSPRADLIGFLEAAYRPEPDHVAWAVGMATALRDCASDGVLSGLTLVAHGDHFADATPLLHAGTDPRWLERSVDLANIAGALTPPMVQALFYPGALCQTMDETTRSLPDTVRPAAAATFQGAPDAFALFSHPMPGMAAVVWNMLGSRNRMTGAERLALSRIAAHLDGAIRLRVSPAQAVAAVLAPDGQLLELEGPGVERQRAKLSASVLAIERSRLRRRQSALTAIDEWCALIAGKYSLVPREDSDGKRYYLLILNSISAQSHARLEPLEVDAIALAARGTNGKGIAYALGISESRVSTTLGQAAAKLGLRSRTELVQVAVLLLGTQASDSALAALTAAEQEILQLVRRGLSNDQIATLRDSSRNTVANQVSSILRKTRRRGRRELTGHPDEPAD